MEVRRFEVGGHKGYRFKDRDGKGCSIQQTDKGLVIGVNVADAGTRMTLDERSAVWLVQVILNYVETGEI